MHVKRNSYITCVCVCHSISAMVMIAIGFALRINTIMLHYIAAICDYNELYNICISSVPDNYLRRTR